MFKFTVSKKVWIIVGATGAILLGGGGGLAFASSSSIPDSNGVIHGCYKPQANGSNSQLGVIDTALPNGRCPGGDTEVDWNQTGPAGATGATGPAGPSTAGSGGLGVTVVTANSGSFSDATAVCPASEPYVIGGGASNSQANSLYESIPWDVTDNTVFTGSEQSGKIYGWHGAASNPGFGTDVYAICSN